MTSPSAPVRTSAAEKSPTVAWVLWLCLGLLGGHRFYLRKPGTALIWMFSGGLLFVGWIVDAVRLSAMVHKVNARGY